MKYLCSCCGKEHKEWPAITFPSPINYHELSEIQKNSIAELDSDFCSIKYENQTDRFIRVVLVQKIEDSELDLQYGFWVSLSEVNFNDYKLIFKDKNNKKNEYFGWLCSSIPQYEDMLSIPTTVVLNNNGNRPEIFPHKDFQHPFVKDYYNGISLIEAEKRVHDVLGFVAARVGKVEANKVKKWWKIW